MKFFGFFSLLLAVSFICFASASSEAKVIERTVVFDITDLMFIDSDDGHGNAGTHFGDQIPVEAFSMEVGDIIRTQVNFVNAVRFTQSPGNEYYSDGTDVALEKLQLGCLFESGQDGGGTVNSTISLNVVGGDVLLGANEGESTSGGAGMTLIRSAWNITDSSVMIDGFYVESEIIALPGEFTVESMSIMLDASMLSVVQATTVYDGGYGTEVSPFRIATAEQLQQVGLHPEDWVAGNHFILTADIDMSGYDGLEGRPAFNMISPYEGAEIEMEDRNIFRGVFDGDGYAISELFIDDTTENSMIGLFGYVYEGTIKNLGVEDCSVSGHTSVGALVGHIYDGTIDNCYSTGTVDGIRYVGGLCGDARDISLTLSGSACAVSGNQEVGGLVGQSIGGSISNCYASGRVLETGINDGAIQFPDAIGGLVGRNYGCDIFSCYATGDVQGELSVGGLLGNSYNCVVSQSFSTGNASGADNAGGLIGHFYGSGEVSDCYATGSVSGDWDVGGLVGSNEVTVSGCYATGSVWGYVSVGSLVGFNFYQDGIGDGVISNSFWLIEEGVPGVGGNSGTVLDTVGKNIEEMMTKSTYTDLPAGWDFVGESDNGVDDVWDICDGFMYPVLAWQVDGDICDDYFLAPGSGTVLDPYRISKATDLVKIGSDPELWDKHFILTSDIDLGLYNDDNDYPNFNCIGSFDVPFSGSFIGNGYVIDGFYWSGIDVDDVGMFGYVGSAGVVSGLQLVNAAIDATDGSNVGIIAGVSDGYIENCSTNGIIFGNYCVGGIVGLNLEDAIISGCGSSGQVEGTFSYTGGVCGNNYAMIENSFSDAIVNGLRYVGGVSGRNNVAGVIENCYGVGDVSGDINVGGLTGYNYMGAIRKSYAAGTVGGNSNAGAFVGYDFDGEGVFADCMWDSTVNGALFGVGNFEVAPAGVSGMSTSEMQDSNTFLDAGWDYVNEADNGMMDLWYQLAGSYPKLFIQARNGDVDYDEDVDAADLGAMGQWWLITYADLAEDERLLCDFDFDGAVNLKDFAMLAENWLITE